jgi:hypothetical protein
MKLYTVNCSHTFRIEDKSSVGIITDCFVMQIALVEFSKAALYKTVRDESRLRVKHLKDSFKMTTNLNAEVIKVEDLDSSTFLKIS